MSLPTFHLRCITVAAAAAAVVMAAATSATASSPTGSPAAQPSYCAVLVGKAQASNGVSPTLSRGCSNISRRDAAIQMMTNRSGHSAPQQVVPYKGALLMTWYRDINYAGPSTDIYAGGVIGGGDTCDSAGYRLSPNYYWAYNLTSAKGHGACNIARFYNIANNFARTYSLPCHYVGISLNDNVGHIQVWHRS